MNITSIDGAITGYGVFSTIRERTEQRFSCGLMAIICGTSLLGYLRIIRNSGKLGYALILARVQTYV